MNIHRKFCLSMTFVWMVFSLVSIVFLFSNRELAFLFSIVGTSLVGAFYFVSKVPTNFNYISLAYLSIVPFGIGQYAITATHYMWFFAIEVGVFIIAIIVFWVLFASKMKLPTPETWVFRIPKVHTRAWIIWACTLAFVIAMTTLFLLHNPLIAIYLTFAFWVVFAQVIGWDFVMHTGQKTMV